MYKNDSMNLLHVVFFKYLFGLTTFLTSKINPPPPQKKKKKKKIP